MAQRLQCLHDESAFRKSEAGLFQSSVIENKGSAPDSIRSIRTVREVNRPCGYLRGKAKQVQCNSAAWLDSPAEFACERLCNLVEVGAQFRREQLAELRAVIDPTNDSTNGTVSLQSVEGRVDGRAAAQVSEVPSGKRPSLSTPLNSAQCFCFNRLVQQDSLSCKKK